jgi:hypothetical protein
MQGQTQDFNDGIRYKNQNQKPADRVAQKPSTSKQSPPICHICEISCSMFLQMYKETMQQHHPVKTTKTHSLHYSFVKNEEVASHCAGAQCGSTYQNTGIMMMKEAMT